MKTELSQSDFLNAEDVRKSQQDRILSCFKETDNLFKADDSKEVKAKVIGQTKSGKAIYSINDHESHKEFDSKDHKDAAKLHKDEAANATKAYKAMNPGKALDSMKEKANYHGEQSAVHESHASKISEMESVKKDEFLHHRMMAGYHAANGKELSKQAADLHSTSNEDLHSSAKEKEAQASRHAKQEKFHAEKAKSLHNAEKHGNWNDTIPKWEEAMSYGKKYAKDVEKKNPVKKEEEDSVDNVIMKDNKLKLEVKKSEGINIEKGGEGSGRHKEEIEESIDRTKDLIQRIINTDGQNSNSQELKAAKRKLVMLESQLKDFSKLNKSEAFEILGVVGENFKK